MRFRTSNNAATVGCTAAAFILTGCVIAGGGFLAGFETPVLKFVIAAYLFMTVPLFLASLLGGAGQSPHRSLRGTPPPYMQGKRVKRRLRVLSYVNALVVLATLTLTYFGQVWALSHFGYHADRRGLVFLVFTFGPLVAAYLASTVFWSLSVRCGWMTPEEARSRRDRLRRGPPKGWLEPDDEKTGK